MMKTPTFFLTHVAVFAVGLAVAWVAQRPDSGETPADARAMSSRSSHAVGVDDETGSPTASRMRRDGEWKLSERAGQSASDRLAEIVRMGDPLERQAALLALINRLGPGEFEAVAELYGTMDRYGDSRGEYEMILRGWAKVDPLGALEYTKDSRGQSYLVLSAWAGNDAAAAERWANDHHEGDGPNRWMAAVISGIAAYDIGHASKLAEAMPFSRERGAAMEAITRALFVQGVDAAMNYPTSIQDPQLRAGFVGNIAKTLAGKDPAKAAAWLASFDDADSQNRASRTVAAALAREDPKAAADWTRTLKPAAQAEAARGVIVPMSSGDITGTAKWVSTLSGIPNYDRVVEEFVWSCDQRAPEQSAAWIQGVSDPAQQTRLYHRMLGDWAKRDAAAVKNWVSNNPVPDSVARRFNR